MELDILINTINHLRPNAEWTLSGYEYDGLVWLDENQSKPTEEEINSAKITVNISELKNKKKQEFYEYFESQKETTLTLRIKGKNYTFEKNSRMELRWLLGLNRVGTDFLYVWNKTNDGFIKLRKRELETLCKIAQSVDTQMDVLYQTNADAIDKLSSEEEINNFTRIDSISEKYS